MNFENAIVVVNKTRLESLVERFNTRAQARFYIEHSGGGVLNSVDKFYNRNRISEIIKNSDPSDYSNQYLVLLCQVKKKRGKLRPTASDAYLSPVKLSVTQR